MSKSVIFRVIVYILLAGGGWYLSSYYSSDKSSHGFSEKDYRENGYIKAKDRYIKYNVYENGEVKPIADMLSAGCNGDDACEIENIFNYVLHLPYKESQIDRDPSAVINQNGGDCDEKAYLFASLLIQRGYECVLIITKEHAFIAVHVKNDKKFSGEAAYLSIEGKKYFYAETSAEGSEIGQFNGFGLDQIESVFDILHKKELQPSQFSLHK